MCSRDSLPHGLLYKDQKIEWHGMLISRKPRKLKVRTGSRASIFIIACRGTDAFRPFRVAVKVQTSDNIRRQRGLRYEKMMYRLMTQLVEQRICPFRLRSYDMQEPENVLVTETYKDLRTLRKFLQERRLTQRESRYLLIQLLYALETNWRLGLRHNDLHPNNVFVKPCRGFNLKLTYLDRNNRQHVIAMPGCRFVILMFDNDRVTKLSATPVCAGKCLTPKNRIFKSGQDPSAVTNLFPWHTPQLRTGLLNQFKLLQHTYSEGQQQQPSLRSLMKKSHVGFENRELMQHANTWCEYEDGGCFKDLMEYLLLTRHGRHEPRYLKNLPDFVKKMPNSDEMMLKLVQTTKDRLVDGRQYIHFSMKKLYK